MKAIAAIVAFIAWGSVLTCLARAAESETGLRAQKPLVVISGADSHVMKPAFERYASPDDWTRAWAKHLGTTVEDHYRAVLDVDFDRCLVVAIFQGAKVNARGIRIESIREGAESIYIRFEELGYQSVVGPNSKPKPPERPYAFIVLPKSSKRIVIEENVQSIKNAPPKWQERARLVAAH